MADYRKQFQDLLYELFQFDSADLDFGFYAVMNQKREQIKSFIESNLLDALDEGLKDVAEQSRVEAQAAFINAKRKIQQSLGEGALEGEELLERHRDLPIGKEYLAAKASLEAAVVAEDLEAQIYNDLYAFFARYYQDGDFISQRRYGRSDKYAIPYNGQEVHLHWANFDQYYVKTGVHFENYSFTVPAGTGLDQGASIHVRLTKVDVARDNVKGDRRYFIYAADQTVTWDEESQTLVIPMEYRPITDEESSRIGKKNQQPKLLEEAYNAILAAITNSTLRARLVEFDSQKSTDKDRLAYHLNRYASENTRDFFVHKDLKGFLSRELDYYLKAEVLRLEDINFDDPLHTRRAAARIKTIRSIGAKIILFLEQLESFQRTLFLKRKFVLQNDYCLTLDKIPPDKRADFYEAIFSNKRQLAEWERLYNVSIKSEKDLELQPRLMIDTAFFDVAFRWELLSCFDDLDSVLDGLLVHGENFQGLNLLSHQYRETVQSIYIDPPYNAEATEIIYKNGYKHSTWLTLINDRVMNSMEFLDSSGVLCVTIDDYELDRLKRLLDDGLSSDSWLGVAVIRNNPSGRSTVKGFAINHEYALFYAKSSREVELGRLPHTEKQISRYNEQTESGSRFEWENFRKNGTDSDRADRTRQFFPIYYNESTNTMRLPHMSWNDVSDRWDVTEPIGNGETEIWPINEDGVEKVWKYGIKRTTKDLHELKVELNNDRFEVYRKKELRPEGSLPRTWWDNPKYSARDNGTRILNDLFGPSKEFDFPKSPYAVMDCLRVANLTPQSLVLDYFAGSGTTAHAVINLNKEDGGKRKYVLIEMADYFDTTLKPRILKVIFSDSWKNGKPVLANRGKQKRLLTNTQPHMFQYIRLESYDDTFYNIRFREVDEPQLKLLSSMPDYFLSYMLDHETEGSPTLLNLKQFDRPFDYKLLVNSQDGVLVPRSVDLVTTFNFLIGLTVHTIRSFEHEGNPYIRVIGTDPKGIRTCILWRNVPAAERFDAERQWLEQEVLTDAIYDKLYVNGENTVPDALLIEDEFKRRMFEGIR